MPVFRARRCSGAPAVSEELSKIGNTPAGSFPFAATDGAPCIVGSALVAGAAGLGKEVLCCKD